MLYMSINNMRTGFVPEWGEAAVVSEVAITVRELKACFDESDEQCYDCLGYKELHIAAVIDRDSGEANYIVSDNSLFHSGEGGYTIHEAYGSPAEYCMSAYSHIFALAAAGAEAYDREYCSIFGTLYGMELECDAGANGEPCGHSCDSCPLEGCKGGLD